MLSLVGGATSLDLLPGETRTVQLVLTDVTSNYTDSNLRILVNGGVGPSPEVTAVFGTSRAMIPTGNLAGSIWTQGGVGPTGLDVVAAFNTNAFIPQQTAGLYATLTVHFPETTRWGVYVFDLSRTDLVNGLDFEFEPIFVDLNAVSFAVTLVPEPSSLVPGLFAAAGLAAVMIRRGRKS
jgi:hypothetical protein